MALLRHAEQVTGNVADACRSFGISRPTNYTQAKRLDLEGPGGLRYPFSAPKSHPPVTSTEIVGKIIHWCQN